MRQGPCLPGPHSPEARSIRGRLGCGCSGPGLGSVRLKDGEGREFWVGVGGEGAYSKQGAWGSECLCMVDGLDGGQSSLGRLEESQGS